MLTMLTHQIEVVNTKMIMKLQRLYEVSNGVVPTYPILCYNDELIYGLELYLRYTPPLQ